MDKMPNDHDPNSQNEDDDCDGLTPAELEEEGARCEAAQKKAEEKAEQVRVDAVLERETRALKDMFTMPLEQKANTQLSVLTKGVLECMTLASLHLNGDPEAPNSDPRRSARRAEMRDAIHLSMASARMLDAYTRMQRGLSKQQSFHSVIKRKMPDGSVAQFVVRETTPVRAFPTDFDVDRPSAQAGQPRAAESQNAQS